MEKDASHKGRARRRVATQQTKRMDACDAHGATFESYERQKDTKRIHSLLEFECHAQKTRSEVETEAG